MRLLSSHTLFRGLAVYGVLVFASSSTVSALIASAQSDAGTTNGMWVQMCASGGLRFISFDDEGDDKTPAPASHAQACHASDRRIGVDVDADDNLNPDES